MQGVMSIADIRRRARWYVGVRWFYLLGVGVPGIASLYVVSGFSQQVQEDIWLVAALLVINGLFLLSTYLRVRRHIVHHMLVACQIVFDVLLMSAAFYLNRESETPLAMFFAIPIVMTAAFFGRRAVYTTGLAIIGIFVTLSMLDYTRVLPAKYIAAPQLHTDPKLFFPPLVTVVAIIFAITLITDLVGRLIRSSEQLVEEMRALTAHNAETEAILRTMGSALVAISRTGKITLVNNSFEKLSGWKRSEVIGYTLDDILPLLDPQGKRVEAAHRPMLEFIADNTPARPLDVRHLTGYSYVRKDGSSFPFIGNVAPIIAGGQIIGFTMVFDDATESKKLDQLKDNFIALISHQLKTPIGEINGYAYNLLGGVGGTMTDKQTEYVTHIQELAARAGKLIADLLDIVLAGRGNLSVQNEPTELGPIISLVAKLHQEHIDQKGLRMETNIPEGLVFVRGDDHKLIQAIGNLVDNAITHSKQGTITLSVVPEDETVNVYIQDQGSGMDKAMIDRIFGTDDEDGPLAHAPNAEGGTGLGVYLAKQLIALMNGTITVTATSKHGTTICVTLNRVKP